MGRPTKLTPETGGKIVALVRAGNYISTACKLARISLHAYHTWKKRGAAGEKPYREFYEELMAAEAEAEARNIQLIQEAAPTTWQAAAWYLERKAPERWGKRDQLLLKLMQMSDEEIDEILDEAGGNAE